MNRKLKIALLIVILAEEIRNACNYKKIANCFFESNTKKCPKCNRRTLQNANFCPFCKYKFN